MRLLSARSRQARFLHGRLSISNAELDYLTKLDQLDHIGLMAAILHEKQWHNVGVGCAIRLSPDSNVAEVALAVLDGYQAIGIGTCLLERFAELAASTGITYFQVVYAYGNEAIDHMVSRIGAVVTESEGGVGVRLIKLGQIIRDLKIKSDQI